MNNLPQYSLFETRRTSVEDPLLKFEASSKIYSGSNTYQWEEILDKYARPIETSFQSTLVLQQEQIMLVSVGVIELIGSEKENMNADNSLHPSPFSSLDTIQESPTESNLEVNEKREESIFQDEMDLKE